MFCIPVRLCPSSPLPPFSQKGRRGSLGVLISRFPNVPLLYRMVHHDETGGLPCQKESSWER
jgi:hypothetical protein